MCETVVGSDKSASDVCYIDCALLTWVLRRLPACRQVDVSASRKAILIRVPFRLLKAFHKIQQRLVRELEKKFSGERLQRQRQRQQQQECHSRMARGPPRCQRQRRQLWEREQQYCGGIGRWRRAGTGAGSSRSAREQRAAAGPPQQLGTACPISHPPPR